MIELERTPARIRVLPSRFHPITVGSVVVTAISDGSFDMPAEALLTDVSANRVRSGLAASFRRPEVETSTTGFVLDTGSTVIVVDTGAGDLLDPTLGNFHANLRAAGYRADEVSHVVLTHLHPDHVGGLARDGAMAFPNAVVHVAAVEADYWLEERNADTAVELHRPFFAAARAMLAPYLDAGRVATFTDPVTLAPGIVTRPLPGHTPGHHGVEVLGDGQRLLLWGDVVHCAELQFAEPAITIRFDSASPEAATVRRALLDEASSDGFVVGGAHLPFPGLGFVGRDGDGHRWIPLYAYLMQ